jgi:hypothetical protein
MPNSVPEEDHGDGYTTETAMVAEALGSPFIMQALQLITGLGRDDIEVAVDDLTEKYDVDSQ